MRGVLDILAAAAIGVALAAALAVGYSDPRGDTPAPAAVESAS